MKELIIDGLRTNWYYKYIIFIMITVCAQSPLFGVLPPYLQGVLCASTLTQTAGFFFAYWAVNFRKWWMLTLYASYIPLAILSAATPVLYISFLEKELWFRIFAWLFLLVFIGTDIVLQFDVGYLLVHKDELPPLPKEHIFSILGSDDEVDIDEDGDKDEAGI